MMGIWRTALFCAFLAGAIPAWLRGQQTEIRFNNIGVDQGLSHSLVASVAEDSLGFLWFGTQDGLNRFDGYEFRTYFKGPTGRTPSDSWISQLYIDRHNQLWIWYTGTGLERYDPFTETFHFYHSDPELPGSISSTQMVPGTPLLEQNQFEDSLGRLWIGTSKGLNLYLRDRDAFRVYRHDPDDPHSLSSDQITVVTEDRDGHLWIGTRNGLNRMDPETGMVVRCRYEPESFRRLTNNIISMIYPHPGGSLWVGTTQGGLNIITHPCTDSMRVDRLISQPLNPHDQPSIYNILRTRKGHMLVASQHGLYRVTAAEAGYREELVPATRGIKIFYLLEDSKESIWAGSDVYLDESLFRLSPDLERVELFTRGQGDPYSYSGKKIQFLHESRNGLLWIGSEKEGVYMVDLNARQFRTIDSHPGRGLFITDSEIYSIYEDDDRRLYIGTKSELNRIDMKDGSLRAYGNFYDLKRDLTYQVSDELPASLIGVLKPHYDGRIWMGAFDYKISLYDPGKEEFLNFHLNETQPGAFQLWSMRSICVTADSQVYFGATGEGMARLGEDGLSFEMFPVVATGDPRGTNDTHIQYLYEDSEGLLWIGTQNGGLNRYDPASGEFRHFVSDPADPGSLSNNRIKCILEPEIYGEGILWVATNNGGLNRFEKATGRFTSYSMKEGLPSNTIHGILEDKVGNLWLSTNRGLVEFNPVTERIIVYTREDGLVGNEFNEGAFFKNREGVMYFGGTNGVNYFIPEDIREKPSYESPLVITGFNLSGKPVFPGDTVNGRVVLERSMAYASQITLTHRDRFFSLEFAALDFAAPRKIRYRYMLEGFDPSWNEADATQRYISYTNIPSGTYRLIVMGTDSDGRWSRHPRQVTLNILPPFWQTFWFRLLMAVSILLIFLAILQVRTQILKNQKRMLEKEVEERTRDLKEANHLLEEQKEEIQRMADRIHESDQMKLKFLTSISHEFRTPLTLIMGPTEKLMHLEDYSNISSVRRELGLMYRNERRLFRLINQLLEVRRVETGNLRLTVAEGDIVTYLQTIHQLFIPYAEKKEITFIFEADPKKIPVCFDADKIEKIFYNLLSNAFKYTPRGGRIRFTVRGAQKSNGKMVRVRVEDSGPGIPPEHLPHIFERFYQIRDRHRTGRVSSGIGLSLSKDLVESHHGQIMVVSEPGRGTCFEVLLPAHKEAYSNEEITGEQDGYSTEYLESMLETYEYIRDDHHPDHPLIGEELFRILVVEDNLDMQEFLFRELSGTCNVVLAQNGEEGLTVARTHLPDLIISDVMMPGMDGLQFCREIKGDELTSHIPVILLTARTSTEDQVTGFETGAEDYITKPFSPEVLRLKVRNFLESRKQLAEKFSSAASYIPENIKITQIDQGFLEKIIKLVEDNIDDPELSGDMLACELGMSKGNLYKKLKTLTGMTVNIFIRTIRLKVAARLLKQGRYNISEIAYAVGFNNPKYFSTCFSEMFSVSPKEYMK